MAWTIAKNADGFFIESIPALRCPLDANQTRPQVSAPDFASDVAVFAGASRGCLYHKR